MPRLTTQLYILRHAWAEDAADDGTDFSRVLTKKGKKRFSRFVGLLVESGLAVDLIATSPLVRTRETAELLAEALADAGRPARMETIDALAPSADWEHLVEWTVQRDVARVAWVGHAPCVGRLVALSIGDATAAIRMQKGAVASIDLPDGLGQPGELQWLVTAEAVGL
jgi:phosphohistidine phosphatase